MRGTKAIVHKIFMCFIVSVLLLGYLSEPTNAALPSVPTGLAASAITQTSATLTWTATSGATSYKLYKNGSSSSCASPTTNTVSITGLTAGITYSFTVAAVNASGTGTKSAALSVTMLPAAPTGLARSAITDTTVTLTWTAPAGATSYRVYKDGNLCASPTTNTTPLTGLTASTTYSFTVAAVNASGEGTKSTALSVKTLPAVPTGLAVSAIAQTTATLTWTASTGATSYKVYKNGSLCASPTTNTASITGLTAGTTYAFTVAAVNASGTGTQSTALSITTLPTVPAAPTGLAKSAITDTSATLTWTASTGATSYRVYKDGSLCASPTTNTASITGLMASTTYSFRVSAVNAGGEGTQSAALSVTTFLVVPAAPTGLGVSAITQTSATLTWAATTGATSYKVYKNGSPYASPTTNAASITGLTAGTIYSFTVSAVNASGEGTQSPALSVTTLPTVQSGPTLKILEVQPGTTFDLTASLLAVTFPNNPIDITQMSMPEFISKVDEINGQYDIVYIGNSSLGTQYSALGTAPTKLPQGGLNDGTGTSKEYYSDNDITNRRANTLKNFINSKQLTIFDQSIFDSRSTKPKLYDNFLSFMNNSAYPNVIMGNIRNAADDNQRINRLVTVFSNYYTSNVAKRPVLTLNSQPVKYDGTDASYQAVKSLGYSFDINNQTDINNMVAKLYIDINGDGIFNVTDGYAGKSELVYEMGSLKSGTGYTINYHLPDSYIGLQPWKLELTDISTGAKSYVTGATAFKGTNSGDEVNIRLLQLIPSGNTFSIYSLSNVNGQNLLYKDKVYKINVTEMNISDFNAAYTNSTPTPASAKVNGVTTTAPTVLNGNYDMLIMGFADIYGGSDLTNTNAIQALKSFINTNQSVMLTHDTLTFQVNSPNTWGYNITQNFRNIVGQQRYYHTAPDSIRYYDPMPDSGKDSYGFTNLTLGRYNNGVSNDGNTFETTTMTHKINDNLVTQFPFPLGDIPVAATHFQYFQLDLEDENVVPVYTLTNSGSSMYNHSGDGRNDYYTYTKGTITFSGTGHSAVNGDSTIDEEKMFLNTIIKASRGANHAPTLEVNGISDGMNIANTLNSIDFSFTATDIDLNDQYQNADIYLATSSDGTTFGDYQNVKHYNAADSDVSRRIKSGVAQSVSIPTVNSGIKAYKVKVVAYDSSNAQVSKEIKLNNVQDPQISVQNFSASCLVGDTISIPVNVTATATVLNETFQGISLQGKMTQPDNTITTAYSANYPDLTFSPNSSWPNNLQTQSFPITFSTVGNYTILNELNYSAYNGVPPNLTGMTTRTNEQSFQVSVGAGTLDVEVLDTRLRGIPGVTVNVTGSRTGVTAASGLASFTGLSSGDYTVSLVVPNGFSIVGSTSQTVSLSASNSYQPIKFKLSGNLITNPSITAQSGGATTTVFKNEPLQANIGVTLNRSASSINLDLANSLSDGSTMYVAFNKVYCNGTEIDFDVDPSNPKKIIPKQPNTSFPSGTYTINSIITFDGSTIQAGQSYTVTLTQLTSAKDVNTGYEDSIDTVASPLTVKLVSGTINVKVCDVNGTGISGITTNLSTGSEPVITNPSGIASFVGLVSGSYTVTLVVPEGQGIVGSTSQTVSLSTDSPVKDITVTLKKLPPAIPIDLTATKITQTTLTLNWTESPGATSYNVYQDGKLIASPTTNTVPVTGLTAETTYSFTVTAVNAGGESAPSTALAVTTLPNPPAAPLVLTATAITQTTLTLNWTESPGATSYNVYQDGKLIASPTTNTVPVTGLTAGTTYSFTVTAVNAGGESAPSTALAVTTLPNPPATPLDLTATAITQTTLTLSWTASPGATYYHVYQDGNLIASPTTNTTPVTGLTAATQYSFTVSAVNAGGESSQSTPLQVKTLNDKLILNPKITTQSGANQISILKNVPLQILGGFDLSRPALYLKIDFSSYLKLDGSNDRINLEQNVELGDISCKDDQGNSQTIPSFTVDDSKKILTASPNTPFPSGTYTINANVTIREGAIEEGQSFEISLTDQTSAQDAKDTTYIDHIDTVSLKTLKVNVGTAPPLH